MGTRLFDRVGKRLVLNDSGRTVLPQARLLVDAAQFIEGRFESQSVASPFRLQIAASTTVGNYVMPPMIAAFLREHRLGQLDLRIGNTKDVASAVAAFDVDIGFIEGPCHEQQMTVVPWMTDELVIVCSPRHPLARRRSRDKINAASLRQCDWLLREPGSGTREAVENALLPHLHHLRSSVQLGSAEAVKLAAAEGLGVACLSRRVVADFVDLGRLNVMNTTLPVLRRKFNLIHHEQKYLSPSLERFIAHCMRAATAYRVAARAASCPSVRGRRRGGPPIISLPSPRTRHVEVIPHFPCGNVVAFGRWRESRHDYEAFLDTENRVRVEIWVARQEQVRHQPAAARGVDDEMYVGRTERMST
jgi:DNA-binding transcriptional LysR family regulator